MISQTSDAIATALGPLHSGDPEKNYDEPQSRVAKLIDDIKGQVGGIMRSST